MSVRFSWLIWALAIATAGEARAAARFDCVDLATMAGAAVDFRDAGAKEDKTVRVARQRNTDRTPAELAVIEREVRRVFREKLPRRQAVANLYGTCRRAGGLMGIES